MYCSARVALQVSRDLCIAPLCPERGRCDSGVCTLASILVHSVAIDTLSKTPHEPSFCSISAHFQNHLWLYKSIIRLLLPTSLLQTTASISDILLIFNPVELLHLPLHSLTFQPQLLIKVDQMLSKIFLGSWCALLTLRIPPVIRV